MCSLWMSMEESDDGNLEAVVRGYSRMNPYKWHPGAAGIDPGATFNGANSISNSNSNSMVFPNLMLTTAPSAPAAMDLQDLCSPFYRNGSNGGGLLRSVSVSSCSSLMFDSMEVEATSAASPSIFGTDSPARTASMKIMSGDKRESEEEFGQGKSCGTELSPRAPEPRDVVGSKPIKAEPAKECDGSSSSLSQAVENGGSGSSQPAASKGQGSKRKKTQQKRIVCVPAAAGGSNRPSGEGLPSDLWAWRKYGQKPIKGSPYPRGYYRCSSSKGCSARKQVERSRTDPTMLVITYTSDHNHPWPTHRNALAGSTRQTATATTSSEKITPAESRTGAPKDEISETIMVSENNPLGENNNNNNNNNGTALSEAAGAGSNSSPERAPADPENLSTIIQDDHDPAAAELGNIFRSDDDFFAELGELPDSLNIFPPRPFDEDKSDDDEAGSSVVDPFNLFNWSPPTTFVNTKTSM